MGLHWYARLPAMHDSRRASEANERAITAAGASEEEIDVALARRDELMEREDEIRTETLRRGHTVTIADASRWPPAIAAHVRSLDGDAARSLLDVLQWQASYYVENLRASGVPMGDFTPRLDAVDAGPDVVAELAARLLAYAERHAGERGRHARTAGLWLYLWASVGCSVETAN